LSEKNIGNRNLRREKEATAGRTIKWVEKNARGNSKGTTQKLRLKVCHVLAEYRRTVSQNT